MTAFEETLERMSTPEVPQLKHQALLADAISRGKSKSALSFWWMSIPLYVIAMLFMKSAYVRDSTLRSNLHEFFTRERYLAPLLFVAAPVILILINAASIRRIHFLSGSPGPATLLRIAWSNVAVIIVSATILIIYFL